MFKFDSNLLNKLTRERGALGKGKASINLNVVSQGGEQNLCRLAFCGRTSTASFHR